MDTDYFGRKRHRDDGRYDDRSHDRGYYRRERYDREYDRGYSGGYDRGYSKRRRRDREDYGRRDRYGGEGLFEGQMKTYKEFLERQDDGITPEEATRKYAEYKEKFEEKQSLEYFQTYKTHEWLREKFHPSYISERLQKISAHAREKAKEFDVNVDASKICLDHRVSVTDTAKVTSEGSQAMETDSANNEVSQEDKAGAEAEKETEKQESEAPTIVEDKEPEKPEGDDGNEDGELEESESPENATETTATATTTVPIAESGEITPLSDSQSSAPIEPTDKVIMLKSIMPSCRRKELEDTLSTVEGCRLVFLRFSSPIQKLGCSRMAWAEYETPEQAAKAAETLKNFRLNDGTELRFSSASPRPLCQYIYAPYVCNKRIEADVQLASKMVEYFNKLHGVESNPLDNATITSPKEHLDLMIYYLREVHCFCFYCGLEYESSTELKRLCCTDHHLRDRVPNEVDTDQSEAHEKWLAAWEKRMQAILKREYDLRPRDVIAEPAINEYVEDHIHKEEVQRFRCTICSKLFRGKSFVEKHIHNKHHEELEGIEEAAVDRQYLDCYLNSAVSLNFSFQKLLRINAGNAGSTTSTSGGRGSRPPRPYHASPSYPPRSRNRGRGRGFAGGGYRPPPERPVPQWVDLDAPSVKANVLDYRTMIVYDE